MNNKGLKLYRWSLWIFLSGFLVMVLGTFIIPMFFEWYEKLFLSTDITMSANVTLGSVVILIVAVVISMILRMITEWKYKVSVNMWDIRLLVLDFLGIFLFSLGGGAGVERDLFVSSMFIVPVISIMSLIRIYRISVSPVV